MENLNDKKFEFLRGFNTERKKHGVIFLVSRICSNTRRSSLSLQNIHLKFEQTCPWKKNNIGYGFNSRQLRHNQ